MADYNRNTYTFILCFSSTLSGVMSYIFYRLFRSNREIARQFKHILVWHPDAELDGHLNRQINHSIDYAAVEGVVKELNHTLHSSYGKEEGVAIRSQIVEHKTKFENGLWIDVKRVIKDSFQIVPFVIVKESNSASKYKVEVMKPGSAYQLQSELQTTYDRIYGFSYSTHDPTQASTFQSVTQRSLIVKGQNWLEILSGELTKGVQVTEEMLLTGTNILGIGKVFLEQGKIKLGPPDNSERPYVLTRMKLNELVEYYESQSTTYKLVAMLAACVGGGLLLYAIYQHRVVQIEEHQQRLEFEEIRRTLGQQRNQFQSVQNTGVDVEQILETTDLRPRDICVVCLTDARNVISLPCGHYAMCSYCAEALPNPKKCPVCRADVERFMAVFQP